MVKQNNNKKIAIFHNYIDNIGGAERVGLTLCKELHADIYSTNINQGMILKMGFSQQIKSIGSVPTDAPWKQQFSLIRFSLFKPKKKYDCIIIDGDWAMSGSFRNKPTIWYVHSPIREIWDLYSYTRKYVIEKYQQPFFDMWVFMNRILNMFFIKRVNTLICNSKNVQQRIKKYLKRDAIVIYPPIDTKKFSFKKSGEFWLSVNRLIPHKRIELQIKAFKQLPNEKLLIVGSFENAKHFLTYKKFIEKNKPSNVTILHHINQKKLEKLYATCKGFITTSLNEDFGMTPVEAMAAGKPVIAPYEGGYKETILDGKTGLLLKNISVEKIIKAIQKISKNPLQYRKACEIQAKKFDTSVFIKKMKLEIEKTIKKHFSN